jgi:hypothetical protein
MPQLPKKELLKVPQLLPKNKKEKRKEKEEEEDQEKDNNEV